MEGLRSYLLSIICAAAICGIAIRFFDGKGAQGAAVKLVGGLFLIFAVIHPIVGFRMTDLSVSTGFYSADVQAAVQEGKMMTQKSLSQGMIEQCEAYILGKAGELGLSVTVEVTLTQDELPVPAGVIISGDISPFKKSRLASILEDDLGIRKEDQIWT